jgi:uncharacterized membrane protein
MSNWIVVIVTSLVTYGEKITGHFVPTRWLENPRLTRINGLLPVALLSALVATATFTTGRHLVLDHRAVGVAAAVVALALRRSFLTVVIVAAVTSALVGHFA